MNTNPSTKQPKIASYLGKSLIMKLCVGIVVNDGRPFSIFESEDQLALIKLAKLQVGENIEIYPEAVKKALQVEAEDKRKEIRNLITGKLLSLSLDMATCRQRSFFGKEPHLLENPENLFILFFKV